jgi:hypothetical protein
MLHRRGNLTYMAEPSVAYALRRESLLRAVGAGLVLAIAACVAIAVMQAHLDHVNTLTPVLAVGALVAGLTVARAHGPASISASFIVALLAAAFLGPASACAAAAISELAASWRLRTSRFSVAINLFAALASALVAANLIRALAPSHSQTALYCLVVLAGACAYVAVSYVIVAPIH